MLVHYYIVKLDLYVLDFYVVNHQMTTFCVCALVHHQSM